MYDRLTRWPVDAPRTAIVLVLALLAISTLLLLRVRLVTDPTRMLSSPAARTLNRIETLFEMQDQAFLLLEADRPGREKDLLRLARSLQAGLADESTVRAVSFGEGLQTQRLLIEKVRPWWVLYFDGSELEQTFSEAGLRERLTIQLNRLSMPGLGPAEEWASRDPLDLHRPLVSRLASLRGAYQFKPGSLAHLSVDGQALLVTVTGAVPASNPSAARQLTDAVQRTAGTALSQPWARGLTVRTTGSYSLTEESERLIRRDLTRSLSLSVLLAALLLAVGLRVRLSAVALLCLPTLWGAVVGIGLFAGIRLELSALSLGCSAILVGLGIDFTIHLSVAAIVQRDGGMSPRDAIHSAILGTRGRLLLAALTSTAAFAAFQVSDQAFLRQMGQLTALGILACFVGAFLLLPPILLRLLQSDAGPPRSLGAVECAVWAHRHAREVLSLTVLATLAALAGIWHIEQPFETDLRKIHARESRPLATQKRISQIFGGSREPLLVLLEGATEQEVLAACQRLETPLAKLIDDGTLVSRFSIAAICPDPIRQAGVLEVLASKDPANVARRLEQALKEVGFDPAAYTDYRRTVEQAAALRVPLTLDQLRQAGLGETIARCIRRSADRSYALVVALPRESLWTDHQREIVVSRLRKAMEKAQATGAISGLYLVSSESARQVRRDFGQVSLLTLGAVLLVLLARFRHPGKVLLVLLPAFLGALWTGGLFAVLGARLNLMNLGVLPMVLAIGVDDGIHLVAHYLEHPEAGIATLYHATGGAVVLTSLTTMVTFGSLALSQNLGLASVGLLSLVGMGGALLASLVVLPAAFGIMERR